MISLWWVRFLIILLPYSLEQIAYWYYVSKPSGTKPGIRRVGDAGFLSYIWDIVHALVLFMALFQAYQHLFTNRDMIGLGVYCVGIAFRILSLRELGGLYANGLALWENHRVIQTGPYRIFRHPLHIGTNLQIIGLALFLPFRFGIPAMIVALVITYFRNRREDAFLLQEMRDEYQVYYRKTWDLIDLFGKGSE